MFNKGEKVRYIPYTNAKLHEHRNGIIKSQHETNSDLYYVVFNFANDPDNYQKYTGELCKTSSLKLGWV